MYLQWVSYATNAGRNLVHGPDARHWDISPPMGGAAGAQP